MSARKPIDWESLLAADGSPAYVPHLIDGELPKVEPPLLAAVVIATAVPAPRRHDGIDVIETSSNLDGIIDCVLYVETRWRCTCGRRFRKVGRHNGVLRKCGVCGVRYFLRIVPIE